MLGSHRYRIFIIWATTPTNFCAFPFSEGSPLLVYTDGSIPTPSIIEASKLGLYGSATPVTLADIAQHPHQVTYMASILSQVCYIVLVKAI